MSSLPFTKRCNRNVGYSSKKNTSIWKDVGLLGINTLCNPEFSFLKRLTWGCIWFIAFICCLIQCINSIKYFNSNPSTVKVKYQYNNTLVAPLLTLCTADGIYRHPGVSPILLEELTGNGTYDTAYKLLLTANITISQLWNISRFVMSDLKYGIVKNLLAEGFSFHNNTVTSRELTTVHGTCLTFKMNVPLECGGLMSGMCIHALGEFPDPKGFVNQYIGIYHTEAEIPLIRYFGGVRRGFYVSYGHYTRITLRVKEVIHINTKQNPCYTEKENIACFMRCLKRCIIADSKSTPCRLPFMEDMDHTPTCRTAEEFLKMYSLMDKAITQITKYKCGCIQPCRKFHYIEESVASNAISLNVSLVDICTVVPSCNVEIIEDQLTYDFTAFFSDIGGSLGLFLGLSVLSFFEVLEILFWKAVHLKHRYLRNRVIDLNVNSNTSETLPV